MFRLVNKLKNKKGFTLIELIVVLAVLAVIMAIAVPRFVGVRETAKEDSDKATIDSIKKLAELEYVRQNEAPTDGELTDLISDNFNETSLFQSNALKSVTASGIDITFDSDGNVETIKAGGKTFNY